MGHALLVQIVAPLLLKRKAEEPPQWLIARVRPTRTAVRRRACFAMVRVPVLLTALRLLIACAQPTSMEMLRMEYALLVPIVASLLPKQHPQMQKPLLIAHA